MNTVTPYQLFTAIFPEPLSSGQLMVWSKIRRSGKTVTDWCCTAHHAARQVERYRHTREVFFGVALQDRRRALARARERCRRISASRVLGTEESVVALPALWAEIAVRPAGPGGAPPPGPPLPGRAQARGLLEAVPRPPSILAWTGAAYQAYWLIAGRDHGGPPVLEGEAGRRWGKSLLAKVHWALAQAAAAEGWRRAVAAGQPEVDLAGRMPVAGTFQHREGRCWPIVVEVFPRRREADHRWPAEDFEKLEDPPADWGQHRGRIEGPIVLGKNGGAAAAEVDAGRTAGPPEDDPPATAGEEGGAAVPATSAAGEGSSGDLGVSPATGGSTAGGRQARAGELPVPPGTTPAPSDARPGSAAAGQPHLELVLRLPPDSTLARAVLEVLRRAALPPGASGPEQGGEPAATPADPWRSFSDGVAELLADFGGRATARRMAEALAAAENRGRFGLLRSALDELYPRLEGGLPTPRRLGYALRSCGSRLAGGPRVLAAGKGGEGRTWTVLEPDGIQTQPKEEPR